MYRKAVPYNKFRTCAVFTVDADEIGTDVPLAIIPLTCYNSSIQDIQEAAMKKSMSVLFAIAGALFFIAMGFVLAEFYFQWKETPTAEVNSSTAQLPTDSEQMNADSKSQKTDSITEQTDSETERTEASKALTARNDFIIQDDVLIEYEGVDSVVVIPDGVRVIADHAFWSIDHIEAVEVPASVEEVGESAFWSCSGLRYVNFEEGIKKFGSTAFWSCPSLEDVNLPSSVTEIGSGAFANCAALTLHVPSGSYAEEYAKYNRIAYDSTYAEFVENTGKSIKPEQYAYADFTEFEIPADITAIGACAFQYCEKLERIDIPSNVESIGGDAFEYCDALQFVNIQEGCKKIGDGAFEYCPMLSDVNIPASVERIEKSSFDYCAKDLTIHTPEGSYAEQYAIAEGIPYDHVMAE